MRKSIWWCGTFLGGLVAHTVPASAACTPEPPLEDTQTMCEGTDPDGLTIAENHVSVLVSEGAVVSARPDGAGAISLERPSGQAIASIQNNGTISNDRGPAITAIGNAEYQGFGSINNVAGATISGTSGAIYAIVGWLDNAGLIDGGNGSAYSFAPSAGASVFPQVIRNSGTIRSDSASATIDLPFGAPQGFLNTGQIINTGTGLAYSLRDTVMLVNDVTGVITSAGPAALQSDLGLSIRNAGTINGSVVAGPAVDFVDTRSGVINGDLLLGDSNDHLIAAMGTGQLIAGVTGVVDPGAGTDLLELIIGEDRTVSNAILSSGFEQLQLNLEKGAVVTLIATQVPDGGFAVRGNGSLVVTSDISTVGPVLTGSITRQNLGAETLSFTNSGALTAQLNQPYEFAVSLGSSGPALNRGLIKGIGGNGAAFRAEYDDIITNDGTIEADQTALSVTGSLVNNGHIRSPGGIGLFNDLGGGTIRGKTSINAGTIEGVDAGVDLSSMTFVNTGTISASNGTGTRLYSSTVDNRQGGVISGTVAGISSDYDAVIINAGIINGGIAFSAAHTGSSDTYIDRGGTVNGNVQFGGGDDVFVANLSRGASGVTGTIDGGAGNDTFRWRVETSAVVAPTLVSNFERLGYELENDASLTISPSGQALQGMQFSGSGRVDLSSDFVGSTDPLLELMADPVARLIDPIAPVSGRLELVSRGSLTYSLDINNLQGQLAAVNASTFVDSPFVVDTREVRFENAGTLRVAGLGGGFVKPFGIQGGTEVVNSGLIELSSAIGVGRADVLVNSGTIRQAASGTISFGVFDVPGVDNRGLIDTQGTAISYDGFSRYPYPDIEVRNTGTIQSRSNVAIRLSANYAPATIENFSGAMIAGSGDAIIVTGSANLRNAGYILGDVLIGLDDSFYGSNIENSGTIDGDVSLGSGNDHFTYRTGSLVTGRVSPGEGMDTLILDLDGTDDAPETLDLTHYAGFEQLGMSRGTGKVGGSVTFQQISVSGGRLIGAPGSTLTAQQFAVESGGTFGSAGTVNGDIVVAGTLSPGASPGTMTINGNVSLASGSNTLFEMSPAMSDAIIIDGALTIASDATMTLTSERRLTPGATYDLLTASRGITGSFTTIDRATSVVGVVRQGADSIRLLGLFALDPEAISDPHAAHMVDHLNGLLLGGTATAGIINAVPTLLDASGFGDAARLRRLTPETYASAAQIGIESGLALASAGRTMAIANGRAEAGLLTFGQWLGNWRRMPGRDGLGTSSADISTRGIVGGVGYGSNVASVGAFVGYIDAKQRLGGLGASTESDGMVAGIIGRAKIGGLELAVTGAFDGSKADTRRALPDGTSAASHYFMHGWTVDANLGYAIDVGHGWSLKPEVGVTYIESKRHGAIENSASPLALLIDRHKAKATFVSWQVTLRGNPQDRIQPWLSVGLRHQTDGHVQIASATLVGTTTPFAVSGAPRDRTQATVAAGLGAAISPMASLFFGLSSEFGADSTGQSANAGVRMQF